MGSIKSISKKISIGAASFIASAVGEWAIDTYLDSVEKSNYMVSALRYLLLGIAIISLIYLAYEVILWLLNLAIESRLKMHLEQMKKEIAQVRDNYENESQKSMKDENNLKQNIVYDNQLLIKYINYRFEKHPIGGALIGGKPSYIKDINQNFDQREIKRLVELRALFERVDYNS